MEIGKTSSIGSFHLFVGRVISTVIAAVGTIILTTLILEADYGLYAVALIPTTTFLLFQDWGIGSAMIRYCAQYREAQKEADLRKIIVSGLSFELGTGLLLTVLSMIMANFVASTIFGKPEATFLIFLASISILATSFSATAQSIFVGFEKMQLVAVTSICLAIGQSLTGPVLVYLGYGAIGVLIGFILGSLVAGMVSAILLYFSIIRKLPKVKIKSSDIAKTLKPLLNYGIPLAIGTILAGILSQFYSFMMASYISDLTLIGNYKVATNFAIIPSFFSVPISTVLFPAFSKLDPEKEKGLLRTVFAASVKYGTLFLVPATMALMALSGSFIGALYGAKWSSAPTFLAITIVGNLFVVFGSLSLLNFLFALGETRLIMKLNALSLAIGVPIAFILIPPFGIYGVIIGALVAVIPTVFIALRLAYKRYGLNVDFSASARIFIASALAAGTVYLFLNVFVLSNWLALFVGLVLFMAIFLSSAPLIGAITQADINNLKSLFCDLGIVSGILAIPLTFTEKILEISTKSRTDNENAKIDYS
jgi:O-antigen/teichoic acid export membrane protein